MFALLRGRLSAPLVTIVVASSLAGIVAPDSTRTAQASFYKARGGRGACDIPRTAPWDTLYAAINKCDWSGSGACGACLLVRGDTDSVVVRVTDRCGGCRKGGLDLSPAAFRKLAPLGRGRTAIAWRFTACPESSLSIARTRGSSVHWSSVQIWGLPWPADSFAVWRDSAWRPFRRQRHNHFTARDLPDTPWNTRLVDVRGGIRLDSTLPLAPGSTLRPDTLCSPPQNRAFEPSADSAPIPPGPR